jgi:hypothetical protein
MQSCGKIDRYLKVGTSIGFTAVFNMPKDTFILLI